MKTDSNAGEVDQPHIVRRCPVCGKPPIIKRYSPAYWYARCEENHFQDSSACPMKTQKAAWEAWDQKFPPNANVDLPDTAAQDSASKSNNPAVSG